MRKLLIVTILLAGALIPQLVIAQPQVPVFGDGPIPDNPFKTWSLFLVCNLEWLTDKRAADLREVFWAYRAFGQTSGARHAAVWFVKSKLGNDPTSVAENPKELDIARSVTYCEKFKLNFDEGPHIVVTTTYPERWTSDTPATTKTGDPMVVLALNKTTPDDIVELLKKLNQQIRNEQLSQRELTSKQYWQSWVNVFEKACHAFDKVKFTVSAKIVSVEKTGLCN